MKSGQRILIVDNKASFRFLLAGYLEDAGFKTTGAGSGHEALQMLSEKSCDLVMTDIVMPEMDGIELLKRIRARWSELPVVLVTAHGSLESAIAGIREGAADYLLKPLHRDMVVMVVRRLLEYSRLRRDFTLMLRDEQQRYGLESLACLSPAMHRVLEQARQVARARYTTVTITGESGVGKEVLARAIHLSSGLPLAKFVTVNCAGIPENLIDSELFGHAKGAFTGAGQKRQGKCGLARGGTLFLDEIGDMPPGLQPKLLRLLDTGEYEVLGSDKTSEANFRIITATHQDLKALCARGRFREDLYYRLNTFPLNIPPLRMRREDIPALVGQLLNNLACFRSTAGCSIDSRAMEILIEHDWPGNVRELRNCLEYAAIMAGGAEIRPEHLKLGPSPQEPVQMSQDQVVLNFRIPAREFSLDEVIQRCLKWALDQSSQNKSSAARLLKTTRKIFYR